MSVEQQQRWITGEEFNAEFRRLLREGAGEGDPRLQELYDRVDARDDYLYERFGQRLRAGNEGKWVAISLTGEVILGETPGQVIHEAERRFGGGNAAVRKLADFPGIEWLTP